jgi:RNA polymerase sporulation-specific sigma factor
MPSHLNCLLDEVGDESLVKLAADGNEDALHTIFERYQGLIRSKASSFSKTESDYDDFMQEAKIGLYKAILNFAPEREVPFCAFAKLCVERQVINAVKKMSRQLSYELPFDETKEQENGVTYSSPEEVVIGNEAFENMKNIIDVHLTKLEKNVLDLYLEGLSYTVIASRLGKDNKAIDNALSRMKKKIAANLQGLC